MRSLLNERMELLEDETLYPFAERCSVESKVFFPYTFVGYIERGERQS